MILEQAPGSEIESVEPTPDSVTPFVVSARSAEALRAQAERLTSTVDASLADLGNSLATTRAALEHRAVVVAGDHGELLRALSAVAVGETAPNVVRGELPAGRMAFLFPGQGSQRIGMNGVLPRVERFSLAALLRGL